MRGTPLIYYHSLNKKPLTLGVNREFFSLSLTLCFLLVFSGRFVNLYSYVVAGILFAVAFFIGRKISAADPQIMEVYRKHINLKVYYPPISGIHARVAVLKPSVPFYEGKS